MNATARSVLVVEDDPDHRAIDCTILKHAGYRILEAADGHAALEIAEAHGPDLVLLDVGLPGMDGWEVMQSLKQHPDTAAIPIVMLTAHVLPQHRVRAKAAGCSAFLAKPIEPVHVVEAVQELIGPPL